MEVVNQDTCAAWYLGYNEEYVVTEEMICAGVVEDDDEHGYRVPDDQGACKGDSGSPLVCQETMTGGTHGRDVLVGLTSWGKVPCAQENSPGVFTKIFSGDHLEWITETLENDNSDSCPESYEPHAASCIRIVDEPQTWEEALKTCQVGGAHLIDLLHEDEFDSLTNLAISRFPDESESMFWTGGNDIKEEGDWEWGVGWDSENVFLRKWWEQDVENGYPKIDYSRNCMALEIIHLHEIDLVNSIFVQKSCDDLHRFVCKIAL